MAFHTLKYQAFWIKHHKSQSLSIGHLARYFMTATNVRLLSEGEWIFHKAAASPFVFEPCLCMIIFLYSTSTKTFLTSCFSDKLALIGKFSTIWWTFRTLLYSYSSVAQKLFAIFFEYIVSHDFFNPSQWLQNKNYMKC